MVLNPWRFWELIPGPLVEPSVFLTTELSSPQCGLLVDINGVKWPLWGTAFHVHTGEHRPPPQVRGLMDKAL